MALETFHQEMDLGILHEMVLETFPEEMNCHEMRLENQYEGTNHVISLGEMTWREMDFATHPEVGIWMVPEISENQCIHMKTIGTKHTGGHL